MTLRITTSTPAVSTPAAQPSTALTPAASTPVNNPGTVCAYTGTTSGQPKRPGQLLIDSAPDVSVGEEYRAFARDVGAQVDDFWTTLFNSPNHFPGSATSYAWTVDGHIEKLEQEGTNEALDMAKKITNTRAQAVKITLFPKLQYRDFIQPLHVNPTTKNTDYSTTWLRCMLRATDADLAVGYVKELGNIRTTLLTDLSNHTSVGDERILRAIEQFIGQRSEQEKKEILPQVAIALYEQARMCPPRERQAWLDFASAFDLSLEYDQVISKAGGDVLEQLNQPLSTELINWLPNFLLKNKKVGLLLAAEYGNHPRDKKTMDVMKKVMKFLNVWPLEAAAFFSKSMSRKRASYRLLCIKKDVLDNHPPKEGPLRRLETSSK